MAPNLRSEPRGSDSRFSLREGQPGGNSSSRESKLPRVRLLAASGAPDPGPGAGDGRRPPALAAGDGRAGNKWFGGCGRDPTASTFPARGGRTARRRRGKPGGKGRCAALGTVCVCGEAPRSASGSAPPSRPPRAACSAAGHRRVSPPARRFTRGTPAAPASPWAGCPPLAACNFRSAAGSDEARPKRPEAPHPRAPCRGCPAPPGSAAGRRRTRLLPEHRATQPAPLSPKLPPPLKSAINFPSLPPPPSSPATQTPPPDAPSRAPSSPAPARPAAPRRPPAPRCARRSQWPGIRPRSDPREPRGARLGAQGMNISVLAKLPSADVMAPAAVATR
ncbi:translation initiation factor IF-2-like [Lutra lutra]|uniref:translation initiation factor IF-2-like n=1 Tax=Lutra lutra TaxID=9657 RepID=UPI001FD28F0B|nr:translation initiation factor IF-2-like [Lutra lutra]